MLQIIFQTCFSVCLEFLGILEDLLRQTECADEVHIATNDCGTFRRPGESMRVILVEGKIVQELIPPVAMGADPCLQGDVGRWLVTCVHVVDRMGTSGWVWSGE